jgi:hypothetical protein
MGVNMFHWFILTFWPWFKEYAYQNFIAWDQLLNVTLGGSADETLSSRCYRTRFIPFFNVLRIIIDAGFYIFQGPDHCEHAYIKEVLGRQLPQRFYEDAIRMNIAFDAARLGPNIEMPL